MSDVKCAVAFWHFGEEYQLQAVSLIAKGTEVLREQALVKAEVGRYAYGSHTWDLVDKILSERRIQQEYYDWRLKQNPKKDGLNRLDMEVMKTLSKKHGVSRQIVQGIYLSVGTNNIGYLAAGRRLQGFGLYKMLSRANHDCTPNAEIMPGNPQAGETVLVARRDILPGEGITWQYLDVADGMDFSAADYYARNWSLAHWCGFVCQCQTCRQEQPEALKGGDALAYFWGKSSVEAARLSGVQAGS